MTREFSDYQRAIARIHSSSPEFSEVKGTGFLVSPRYLFTCAHVVKAALGLHEGDFRQRPSEVIWVDFPGLVDESGCNAEVVYWRPCHDPLELNNARLGEDIALLRLEKAIAAFLPIPLQTLAEVHEYPFSLYGFPKVRSKQSSSKSLGKETSGTIRAEQKYRQWYQLQVNAGQQPIEGGFSGAPLWCGEMQAIVGMTTVADGYDPKTDLGGREAYAIASSVLDQVWQEQGRLMELLDEVPWESIRRAHRYCRNPLTGYWEDKWPMDTAGAITDLWNMEHRPEKAKPQIKEKQRLTFSAYLLTREKLSIKQQNDLTNWVREKFPEDYEGAIANQEKEAKAPPTPKRLSLVISQCETDERYQLEYACEIEITDKGEIPRHIDVKPNSLHLSTLDVDIKPLLNDIQRQISGSRMNMVLEVFLPRKVLHLVSPDQWLIEDEDEPKKSLRLGTVFPVVLRILERVSDSYRGQEQWEWNWQSELLREPCEDALTCCRSQPNSEIILGLENQLTIGLRSDRPLDDSSLACQPYELIKRERIPIALWLRQPLENCCDERQHRQYTKLLASSLQALPKYLRAIRNDCRTDPNHLACNVSLLWDNPHETLPPAFSNQHDLEDPP